MTISENQRNIIRSLILGGLSISESERLAAVEKAVEKGLYLRKWSNEIKGIDRDKKEMDFVVTTDTVDRDSERVIPRSFEKHFKLYESNPVVLFAHDHKTPAVAQMISYEFTDKDFSVRNRFAADESPLAATLWNLYSAEPPYMRAVSVGFIPIEWSEDTDKKLPGQRGRTFVESEMLEHSLVNVGSNRFALSKMWQEEKDTSLKAILEALIEQPPRARCGHRTVYDENVSALDPCPFCEGQEGLLVRMAVDETLAESLKWLAEKKDIPDSHKQERIDLDAQLYQDFLEKETKPIEDSEIERPYPSEHACRLRNPSDFQAGSFRSLEREHEGKKYRMIMGRLKGQTTMTAQSIRYPKSGWTTESARAHCKSHDGMSFEAAKELGQVISENKEYYDMHAFFTMPGSYERAQRDLRHELKRIKVALLGMNTYDSLVLIGTFPTQAFCFACDNDIFYRVDWTRNETTGMIEISNPVTIEPTFSENGESTMMESHPEETKDDEQSQVESGDIMIANILRAAQDILHQV